MQSTKQKKRPFLINSQGLGSFCKQTALVFICKCLLKCLNMKKIQDKKESDHFK